MNHDTGKFVRNLRTLGNQDVSAVGGKNASLGEMITTLSERGVRVPGGFASTAEAYRSFLEANELEGKIKDALIALDSEVVQLARWGTVIEDHYGKPMDIEWARDGGSGELFILQARPETVHSQKNPSKITKYYLQDSGEEIVLGIAIGQKAASDRVKVLHSPDEHDKFETETIHVDEAPKTKTEIMMNLASPAVAFRWAALPTAGVGLARVEFIINNTIQAHPLALLHPDKITDKDERKQIKELTEGWESDAKYFTRTLSEGLAQIAATQYPKPAIVRLSDFKTNEYAQLLGGAVFEPSEENPMLGFRGASRYRSGRYREAFALECAALKRAREHIGMDTIVIMIPFCRTPEEVDGVLAKMAEHGLVRGGKGLKVYLMAEVPSNVFQAANFAALCDGSSIGSNDLTQLVLGISRDSEELSPYFDEMDESVTNAIRILIEEAHKAGIKIGICGQGPSDKPEFAEFLVRHGIDSISLNPDTVMQIAQAIANLEKKS